MADNTVAAIVAQADGTILLGGYFTTLAGSARNHIGKVFADGSLDTGFNPECGLGGPGFSIAERTARL